MLQRTDVEFETEKLEEILLETEWFGIPIPIIMASDYA
jgi:hypothetical protein